MNQIRKQQGFTMIELIMVIVILGVLSAFALPRFADLGGSAREAAVEGVAGSIRSAVGITRAQVLASAISTTAAGNSGSPEIVSLDGADVELGFGYPLATDATTATNVEANGIVLAAGLADESAVDGVSLTNGDFTIAPTGAGVIRATLQTNCWVQYTEAADASTAPQVTTEVSGC